MLTDLILDLDEKLRILDIDYAIAGGIAAGYYRDSVRATDDLDIILGARNFNLDKVQSILSSLGLKAVLATRSQLEGNTRFKRKAKRSDVQLVAGMPQTVAQVKVDFLLSSIPWVQRAVDRAKNNLIQLKVKKIPVITLEDLIIGKLIALKHRPDRITDIDDLRSIFRNNTTVDSTYLIEQLLSYKISLPKEIEKVVDFKLARVSRKVRRLKLNR